MVSATPSCFLPPPPPPLLLSLTPLPPGRNSETCCYSCRHPPLLPLSVQAVSHGELSQWQTGGPAFGRGSVQLSAHVPGLNSATELLDPPSYVLRVPLPLRATGGWSPGRQARSCDHLPHRLMANETCAHTLPWGEVLLSPCCSGRGVSGCQGVQVAVFLQPPIPPVRPHPVQPAK